MGPGPVPWDQIRKYADEVLGIVGDDEAFLIFKAAMAELDDEWLIQYNKRAQRAGNRNTSGDSGDRTRMTRSEAEAELEG